VLPDFDEIEAGLRSGVYTHFCGLPCRLTFQIDAAGVNRFSKPLYPI
jgi:hypothetical protein